LIQFLGVVSHYFLGMVSIAPLTWVGVFAVIFSGVIIGMERQILGKPAGMKTSVLITMSTYLFVAISIYMGTDYLRVVGQVVTGVGFLGGGVILSREGVIQGMTSASVIWILSAIGVIIGLGYPLIGVKLAVLMVLVLYGLGFIERKTPFLQRGVHRLHRKINAKDDE